MPLKGYLTKRGRKFKTWRRRWVVVNGPLLQYYLSEGGQQRGEMSLAEGRVEDVDPYFFGRPNVAAVVTPSRTLYIQAETPQQLNVWRATLSEVMGGKGRTGATRAPPPPPMPDMIDIDGVAEVGSELRVRAGGSLLEALCVAWFRFPASASAPEVTADPSKVPGVAMIPGATLQTYRVTDRDLGYRIGCTAQPATGDLFVNGVTRLPIAAVDMSVPAARVTLVAHKHHKFCDRRVRVCTAEGRYREGEVLQLTTRGPDMAKYRIVWSRSPLVVGPTGEVLLGGGAGSRRSSTAAAASLVAAVASSGADHDGDDDARERALTQARMQRIIRLSPEQLASLTFEPVLARPLWHLPATPQAHESAPSPEAFLSPPVAGPSATQPGPPSGATMMPFLPDDVGRMVRAELHPIDSASGAKVIVSNAVGPIEPSPPRARIIWVEGTPAVGGLLLGRWFYVGGTSGNTEVSWVRVAPDGSSSEVKGPVSVSSKSMPPGLGAKPSAADDHPCAYRVQAADVDCIFKFRVKPVRADGDEGHAEAGRLPSKIIAAPADFDDVEQSWTDKAPTVIAAKAWAAFSPSKSEDAVPVPVRGGVHLGGEDWVKTALG